MGPKILLGIIFILHLQIWPPLVVKFLTSGVWKVLYMGGIQNEQVRKSEIFQYNNAWWRRWDKRLINQASDVPSIIFSIISCRLWALKTRLFL